MSVNRVTGRRGLVKRRAVDSPSVTRDPSLDAVEPIRLRLDLAYDGTDFAGWATQPGLRTVQGVLHEALVTLFAHTAHPPPTLTVAGRTDAGVHATGQVAHLDLHPEQWAAFERPARGGEGVPLPVVEILRRRLEGIAGRAGDLRVLNVDLAPPGFDARFSPLWRRYEYRIADAHTVADPRRRAFTMVVRDALDVDAMNQASDSLLGLRNFGAFCKPRPGATTIRTLLDYRWMREADGTLVATVRADAFCHSMVRSLVGAALAVGRGSLGLSTLEAARDAAERGSLFPVVAAHGLTLVEVAYPSDTEVALRAAETRARREIAPESSVE